MEIRTVDYHTAGEPFRIVTGGVDAAARSDDPRQAPRRARSARPRAPAARPRAARARGHVRLLRRRAERRRRGPRRRLLPQRGVLDRLRARDDRARHVGARRGRRRAAARARTTSSSTCRRAGSRPGRRWRTVAFARCDSGTSRRSCRPPGSRSASTSVDVAFGGAFYASVEEHVTPSELPRLIELGRDLKRSSRGVAGRRASARARAPRRLRRDLLAGGGRGSADPAQRHGLRGRRGGSLPVRERHVGAARSARPLGTAAARRRSSAIGASSTRSSAPAWWATRMWRASRR